MDSHCTVATAIYQTDRTTSTLLVSAETQSSIFFFKLVDESLLANATPGTLVSCPLIILYRHQHPDERPRPRPSARARITSSSARSSAPGLCRCRCCCHLDRRQRSLFLVSVPELGHLVPAGLLVAWHSSNSADLSGFPVKESLQPALDLGQDWATVFTLFAEQKKKKTPAAATRTLWPCSFQNTACSLPPKSHLWTMTSTAHSPHHHHAHQAATIMSTLTPESLPASPSKTSSTGSLPHSVTSSDPSPAMSAAVQSSTPLPTPAHAHLDPIIDDDADPMLAAAYLLSFMREQGAKPRSAAAIPIVAGPSSNPPPDQEQQDVVMHDADADTPVLEPAIPPGLPSTMDLGDVASQPTSLLAAPSSTVSAVTATSPNAARTAAHVAPSAQGSGTGVLIPSTTKKSSTRCKSLPSVLEYPDYLIPLNAPIQHKTASSNLSLSQSAASSLASLPEEPALASSSAALGPAMSEAPATPGRASRKRPRTAPGAAAAAASSDEGDLAMDGLGDQDEAAAVKRARVGVSNMVVGHHHHPHDPASRAGSPTMDLTDPPTLSSSSSSQQANARVRKPSSRRSGAPAAASAVTAAPIAATSTSSSSTSATPTTTPQLGRPSTTLAAAAKAANEAFLKEVVPDLSSLDPKEAKRVRNTLSARASRARKAAKIEFLETRVNDLESLMEVVVDENAMLRKMLADAGVQGVPESSWAKMPGAAPWPEQFRDSAPLFIGAQCGVASGSGGEEAEAAVVEGQDGGPKRRKGGAVKGHGKGHAKSAAAAESVSVSAPGSVDGDVHMDDYHQQFEAMHSGPTMYLAPPSLTAPISVASRASSPTSSASASQSYSSSSSSLPPIAAVVGDLPYPPASSTLRFPPPLQPQQQQVAGLPAGVYQPSFAYPAHASASASVASSRSASPVRSAFPPPTSGPSSSR